MVSAYIVTENAIKRLNSSIEYKNAEIDWFFESSDLLEGIFEKKGINEITIKAKLEKGTTMTVSTRDDEGVLTEHKTFIGDGKINTYRVPVKFSKKDAYRYRIEGHGPAFIYEIERSVALGGRAIKEG